MKEMRRRFGGDEEELKRRYRGYEGGKERTLGDEKEYMRR